MCQALDAASSDDPLAVHKAATGHAYTRGEGVILYVAPEK
jgi:hypothetical protein